jgi:hypothetical protein
VDADDVGEVRERDLLEPIVDAGARVAVPASRSRSISRLLPSRISSGVESRAE